MTSLYSELEELEYAVQALSEERQEIREDIEAEREKIFRECQEQMLSEKDRYMESVQNELHRGNLFKMYSLVLTFMIIIGCIGLVVL